MFDNKHRSKMRTEVELLLDDGSSLLCKLAVAQEQRLSDVMNDDRVFLPVEISNGYVVLIRKNTIVKAVQLDQKVDTMNAKDPYELLGVDSSITNEQLTRAYRSLCSENHPDKLQASGLSPRFIDIANTRMARINDAYKRILDSRQATEGADVDRRPA
jgi:DnaJ-domain-containing protein 1